MSKIIELFGKATDNMSEDWPQVVKDQLCIFTGRKCYKTRKSDSATSIGTCTVLYGRDPEAIIICPIRLIERGQIFTDCLHLLTMHEPGNELHIVSEVTIPGGHVDFFLVSVRDDKIKDFVGIEIQTLDTTGTLWPERQRLLKEFGIPRSDNAEDVNKSYGMNWKMTAKTILVQMHHKVQTFEHLNKKLVLVMQDRLLEYMKSEFRFDHLQQKAVIGDSMHFHAYSMKGSSTESYKIVMDSRLSTDSDGIGQCLGLQSEARVELEQIIIILQKKISPATIFSPI